MHVRLLCHEARMPSRVHEYDSGLDLHAVGEYQIHPNTHALVRTGIAIELPIGQEAQIRSRSGLANKFSVVVLNSPGTVDCEYRGEIKVILHNFGTEDFFINTGDRIAQMVIANVNLVRPYEVMELSDSARDANGFGSTGR